MIPPSTRRSISSTYSTGYAWTASTLSWGGKALWVVSTSALLVGLPWALAYGDEQQQIEMEREMKMQQSANEVSAVARWTFQAIDFAVWMDANSECIAVDGAWWFKSGTGAGGAVMGVSGGTACGLRSWVRFDGNTTLSMF
jgi:hypothetical protein